MKRTRAKSSIFYKMSISSFQNGNAELVILRQMPLFIVSRGRQALGFPLVAFLLFFQCLFLI